MHVNVYLSYNKPVKRGGPHSIGECFHNMATTGLQSIVDVMQGRTPQFVVNRDVFIHKRVQAWLKK